MKVVFLGTNGWYDTETGNTICTIIDSTDQYIVFDAGSGLHKLDKYVKEEKPVHLFLSHFHLDHIAGMHILAKFNFKEGLKVYGPEGTKDALEKIINHPYTIPLKELPYKAKAYDLKEGIHKLPFKTECRLLVHSTICMGYRIETDSRIIAYVTDTGYCENAVRLAKDADLLITECALKPGIETPNWPHLNPKTASRIGLEADTKKVVLTHFDAKAYTTLLERQDVSRTYKDLTAATDDMVLEV
jgi:ribonuclease BN (tRNA processing enzyme)